MSNLLNRTGTPLGIGTKRVAGYRYVRTASRGNLLVNYRPFHPQIISGSELRMLEKLPVLRASRPSRPKLWTQTLNGSYR